MTRSRNIERPAHRWDDFEQALLVAIYPHAPTAAIARAFGLPVHVIYNKAYSLRLRKSDAYLASEISGRLQAHDTRGGATRFAKGHVPWNAGKQIGSHPGSVATQFKKGDRTGRARENWVPVGTLRINGDGYLDRKIADAPTPLHRRWVGVHRLVWEAVHGPVPEGCAVVFKPGCRSTELAAITIDKLELLTRAQLMRRNTIHNLPKPLADLARLKGVLVRQINKREKQNGK
jgi:hypothetical protein